jgi:hypothetical protein
MKATKERAAEAVDVAKDTASDAAQMVNDQEKKEDVEGN